MSYQGKYMRAMQRGDIDACVQIEQKHGLYGYPPELVSVGLAAADKGENAEEAVEKYLNGEDME